MLLLGFVESSLDASANATSKNPNVRSCSSLAGFILLCLVRYVCVCVVCVVKQLLFNFIHIIEIIYILYIYIKWLFVKLIMKHQKKAWRIYVIRRGRGRASRRGRGRGQR